MDNNEKFIKNENSKHNDDNNSTITNSEETNDSSKPDLKQKSNLNQEEKEDKKSLDSNLLNKEDQKSSDKKEINKKEEKKTPNINETKDKENDKFYKEKELIKEIKKDNYRKLYTKHKFCDFRYRESGTWKVGLINDILEDSLVINDFQNDRNCQIKIDDFTRLSYLRKNSKILEENFYQKRDNKEVLAKKLSSLENGIKDVFNNKEKELDNAWDLYYFLHSKIFFGLDCAMKVNIEYNYMYERSSSENEGAEESLRIILLILNFLCQYYKYILENKEEFFNYINNLVDKPEFADLKIVNKKYAFFSFFDNSLDLLNKIFANSEHYLGWFKIFEDQLKKIFPSIKDEKIKKNPNYYPLYEENEEEVNKTKNSKKEKSKEEEKKEDEKKEEEKKEEEKKEEEKKEEEKKEEEKKEEEKKDKDQKDEEKNDNIKKEEKDIKTENSENKEILLKRVCLEGAYKLVTTYTTEGVKIKAAFVAYFIDYFHAFKGFSYLYQLCYCSKAVKLKFIFEILSAFNYVRAMTGTFKRLCPEEKKQFLQFIYDFIDNLDEKILAEYKNDEIIQLINKIPSFISNDKDEDKILENLLFNYYSKNLLISKKLEQKISSLNYINEILNDVQKKNSRNKNKFKKMTLVDFSINCKKNKILQTLLSDKNVHEEIIKRLPNIIFVMYKNNFGYQNKEDEEKIKSDKKMIFTVLFDKLLESEQNNQKLVKSIQNIICDFCEILSEEDKLYVYEEIKKYLEKSIEKKGIPIKDHLSFIIDYSLRAIKENGETKGQDKDDKEDKKDEEEIKNEENGGKVKEKKEEDINKGDIKDRETKKPEENENDEKIKNFQLSENKYYGLNLLVNYLSEEQYQKYKMVNDQKIELIDTSIDGIIRIITNYEKNDILLKYLVFKIISSINNSKDIIQNLILFQKIIDNISPNKKLILEEYCKNNKFLSSLMSDMSRYLSIVNTNRKEEEIDKEEKKVYEGLYENKLNIKLRLELIFIFLQKNTNEENLENFSKQIINSCEKNKFANDCLNKFIHQKLKTLDIKFKQYFYDNVLLATEKISNVNEFEYYKLCNEIIKEINKENKIFYFMNNKDLAVINCESEKEIKGIDLLWNFLIKTKNDNIRNNVTELLADIFLGIKINEKEKIENYWKNFIKSIYDKLDEIVKVEKEQKDINQDENSVHGIISLIKKIENKFSSKGDTITNISKILEEINLNKVEKLNELENKENNEENEENQKEKQKKRNKTIEDEDVKKIIFSGNVYGTDNILNYDIKIDRTEYFYMFRYKLSSFFKIPVNLVKVVVDVDKYDKQIQEDLKKYEFDLFNDFDNSYSLFENIEQIINKKEKIIDNRNPLILKVESIKDNEKLKYIKKLIKDFPKLLELLKRKNSEYLLDVWCLIKEDDLKISSNIIEIIKESLKNENTKKINSIFNFENTNIYYISYILFHLNSVINDMNKTDENFINNVFLKSYVWEQKVKNIKLENSSKPHLGEIYEKNNIINYLLNIFKIISQKSQDRNILNFTLNKVFDYYYQTINECITVNLRGLPSTEGITVDIVEDLYISNASLIKEIIIQNKIIYNNFINILISKNNGTETNNKIKSQFQFLYSEGLLKNRIYTLNQKLQSFLLTIADENFFKNENYLLLNDFYLYLINLFLNPEIYQSIINYIKDIALDNNMDICLNIEKYEKNIQLYFDIVINIIDKVYPLINKKFNFKSYIKIISLEKIYNPIIDSIPLEVSYHQIIFGGNCKILLNLLSKSTNYKDLLGLKDDEEKKLKHYLFDDIILNKCNKNIFTEDNIDNYKSLSMTSYAFKEATNLFIFLLMQNIQNEEEKEINYFFEKLNDLHKQCYWKGNSFLDWKIEYKDNNRLSPFVGLKNLGCTCYMNSLLQVFFNFIPFRESLLKCKCKEEKKNSLYQIKKLFYSLKYLQIDYYIPSDFPNNFDDEVLNVHLQMDVDEFFGNILDKIENRLKNTKNENLVKYFFQGRQNDNLTFQEGCTHHRTNVNNFYSIQLQIQNKKNLYESLDTLTEGELMNGDNCIFCPECNKKFPAVKSQNFKTLPRMLIFVLKRFEFNYDTMRKVKINDYYEFPLELDMTKYISEKKNNVKLNQYTLKSIVVHMGNSEGGHYYAFIKSKNEEWYEFNDTQITRFDISLLKEETFGGKEVFNSNGNKEVSEKNRSAYLLFYEKKIQTDCEQFDNIEAINSFLGLNNNHKEIKDENVENGETKISAGNDNGETKSTDLDNNNSEDKDEDKDKNEYGMKEILENINKEMFKYFLNKKLFSNEYQYLILELYLNILNYYYNYDLPLYLMHLCRNSNNREMLREIPIVNSNINSYIEKKKLILFSKTKKEYKKGFEQEYKEQIFNAFKYFIIYFYNVFLRTKEKEYLGCMVDLLKLFLNEHTNCSNYLIEEFCNKNVIIEYLINCPLYEIKKLIVGILYCSMIKSVNEYEIEKRKEENDKKKIKNKTKDKKQKNKVSSMKEDEELARQLNDMNNNDDYIYNNPLEYENIPKNILKMIYNILNLIRNMGYSHLNEQRFLYFIIYRFSLISQNTRTFLINKCLLFELLCLLLHKNIATFSHDTSAIISSTNVGPYTVSHNILNTKGKIEEDITADKSGVYKIENYIYLLFFYLLSYTPKNGKSLIKEDSGYSLENKDFVKVLLNNIRTKQDAFAFSNYINEKTKNNKDRIIAVFESLLDYLNRIDNNENTNYDYNNYTNFVNNNMNESPTSNDPGMNPKYFFLIFRRFISTLNPKLDYVQKGIKIIFKILFSHQIYYNYCIMVIEFIVEIFSLYLRGYTSVFKKELELLLEWFQNNPIAPTLYDINGISLYRYERKNYDNNVSEEKKNEFNSKEIEKTQQRINKIQKILKNEPIDLEKNVNEKDLSDFKFIIGDVILYDGKEVVIEEALDELLKITIEINKKNGKKRGVNEKKEIWIEIDDPKIEIK